MNGWVDGWMGGWVDGWMGGWKNTMVKKLVVVSVIAILMTMTVILVIRLDKAASLRTALRWCGSAPLPKSAKILSIEETGGWDTHGYRCKFTASKRDIQRWLNNSPGIKQSLLDPPSSSDKVIFGQKDKDGSIIIKAHNTYKYIILYNRNATYAEINIDPSYNYIELYAYSTQ